MAHAPRQVNGRAPAGRRRRWRPAASGRVPGVPTFDEALRALQAGDLEAAIALFAARTLAHPADHPSHANYAIALYRAGRHAQAAELFEKVIEEAGPGSLVAVGFSYCLGHARLELGDPYRALAATTEFLDWSNEWNPLYLDGVSNTAEAWSQLGTVAEALELRQAVASVQRTDELMRRIGLPGGRLPYVGPWPRRRIIERSFRILGFIRKARPPRRCNWRAR